MTLAPVPIDGLPLATLPLAGTEPMVLIQNGVTRQTPVNSVPGTVAALSYSVKQIAFNATAGGRYALVTSVGAITATLPASSLGAAVLLADVSKNAQTNHITIIAVSPDQIVYGAATATNQTVSVNGAVVTLVCYATNRWRALVQATA